MLVDAIALVILAGMMLIPLINIVVGAIVGLGMGGIPGGVIGVMLAVVISLAEKLIGDRRGWFRVGCEPEYVASEGEGARITLPYPMRISSIERFGTGAASERLFGAGAILEPHIAFRGFDKEDSAATINGLLVSQG